MLFGTGSWDPPLVLAFSLCVPTPRYCLKNRQAVVGRHRYPCSKTQAYRPAAARHRRLIARSVNILLKLGGNTKEIKTKLMAQIFYHSSLTPVDTSSIKAIAG